MIYQSHDESYNILSFTLCTQLTIFFTYFYLGKQISRIWHWTFQVKTNSVGVIRLEVMGLNVMVLNSCAVNVVRSFGQVDKMEFDEMGQGADYPL